MLYGSRWVYIWLDRSLSCIIFQKNCLDCIAYFWLWTKTDNDQNCQSGIFRMPRPWACNKSTKKWKNNFFCSSDSKVFEISMNKAPKKAYSAPPVWARHFSMPKMDSPWNFVYYTCITCIWVILNSAPKTYTCKLFILPIFWSRLGMNF